MQPETSIDHYRLLVETEFGIRDRDEWDNQAFEKLSSRILEKTGERLSVSTLKRIWGKVSYDHAPAKSTLNILARYAGYENWRSFTVQHAISPEKSIPATPAENNPAIPQQSLRSTVPWKFTKKNDTADRPGCDHHRNRYAVPKTQDNTVFTTSRNQL
ncbi:hypothetical protein [Pedobacter hartonius]|uniref:Uncharacterized protein n=1 Tax=Pedobacter hartonius TaxID=425514 RepID=A0A1H3WPC2_9SPHI|nr:hypothetical protein [Pedobacter hartonius]SDZ88194.1 hypothetical protein SAMN05443550_101313 [Pedobacter hartonius]